MQYRDPAMAAEMARGNLLKVATALAISESKDGNLIKII